jgi:hypothetical protein
MINVLPLKLSKYLIAIFNALNLTAYIILILNENIMYKTQKTTILALKD